MLTKSQNGFTLIELMIVVAIVGILSAIGIPAYQNYTIRAQVSEGLTLAGGWKAAITEYYATNGAWPSQSDLAGTADSVGVYGSNVTVKNGVIKIIYGGPQVNQTINNAVLTLVPYTSDNNDILWQCGLAAAPAGTPPSGDLEVTTLSPTQLPTPCRS